MSELEHLKRILREYIDKPEFEGVALEICLKSGRALHSVLNDIWSECLDDFKDPYALMEMLFRIAHKSGVDTGALKSKALEAHQKLLDSGGGDDLRFYAITAGTEDREGSPTIWRINDGVSLVSHVHPNDRIILDEVERAKAVLRGRMKQLSERELSMAMCDALYRGICRHKYRYDIERVSGEYGTQAIRTPEQIRTHKNGTCIDFACLFSSLLEAAGENPLLIVLSGVSVEHALVGYRVRSEVAWDNRGLGDLRGALSRGDAVLFEPTGAVLNETGVGVVNQQDMVNGMLSFEDARRAADALIRRDDVSLSHFLDVRKLRARNVTIKQSGA